MTISPCRQDIAAAAWNVNDRAVSGSRILSCLAASGNSAYKLKGLFGGDELAALWRPCYSAPETLCSFRLLRSSTCATAAIAALDRQRRLSLDQLLGCQRREIAAAGGYRLAGIGIPGEIVHTPGHSDHCVTLLLDDGSAFTGDLPPEDYSFDNPTALASWEMLRRRGAGMVYPAHGPVRPLGGPSLLA